MGRQPKRLMARTVAGLTKPGRHADGQNLYLSISPTASGLSKRWTFLYTIDGRQREAGFGSSAAVTLAQARTRAAEYREMLALAAKAAAGEARKTARTFGELAVELIARDASKLCGISSSTIFEHIKAGRLKSVKIGGHRLIHAVELNRFLQIKE